MTLLKKDEYLDIIANGASLTSLCETTASILNNPVALTLPTRTIIARSRNYTGELVEEYTNACCDMTEDEQRENHDMLQRRLMTRRSFIGLYPYLRHKRLNCGCFWKGTLIAVLDVPIIHKIMVEDALKSLEEAASVFTPAIVLNGGIPNGTVDPVESHLIGLLRGEILPGFQQTFHYNIPIQCISRWHIIWSEPFDSDFLPDITGQIYAFCASHPSIWCTRWSDGLVILVDADKISYVHALQNQISDTVFSISEPFEDLTEVSTFLHQAHFALHIAQYENPTVNLCFAQNYKIPMFFLSQAQTAPGKEYKSLLLEKIMAYDREHNSVYFETLRAYLLHNMDLSEIASVLNVHRNTVAYRLQRLEELFQINLSDCRIITELYLSLFTQMLPSS